MALDERSEEIARGHRARLVQLETEYLRAKEYLKSDKFATDQITTLGRIRNGISPKPKDAGEAFFIVGMIAQMIKDAYRFEDVITEYESTQQTLAKMFPAK